MKLQKIMDKIKLGISSCLLGESVRYDAGHKLDHFLKSAFDKLVEWVSVCPEAECGLGIPREAMHLTGALESSRLVTNLTNIDYTDKMLKWAEKRLKELKKEKISGFIFKANSPSCGLYNVLHEKGTGIFAMALMRYFRALPVEDEERLRDESVRKKFIEDISIYSSNQ
ncbi:MAG: DUF523 domain-containing protein [Candidatus Omnitrophota bacterium]|nr:DUF523 domain-containing protein [Candidatus Omnitrophota bacterium]